MREARDAILGALRRQIPRTEAQATKASETVAGRLANPAPNLIPERGNLDPAARIALFESMARAVQTDIVPIETIEDLPAAITRYLRDHNLPQKLVIAPNPVFERAKFETQPLLRVSKEPIGGDDATGLTLAAAGIAETGTLMLVSDPSAPSLLAVLPETSLVVLFADDVEGSYEAAWQRLRLNMGEPPRSVNLITGPSRTGDIAQKLELGAHGPKRLMVAIVAKSLDTDPGDG